MTTREFKKEIEELKNLIKQLQARLPAENPVSMRGLLVLASDLRDGRTVWEFTIKQGTGNNSWNSIATALELKVGEILRIRNADASSNHGLHTSMAPCRHGGTRQYDAQGNRLMLDPNKIAVGAFIECDIDTAIDASAADSATPVYDEQSGTSARLYLISRGEDPVTPAPTSSTLGKSLTLKVSPENLKQTPIDLIIAVDQTGSMVEEVAIFKSRIGAFIDNLRTGNDVRITLIANPFPSPDTGVDLRAILGGAVATGDVQIPITIGDRSILAALAAGICPLDQTEITDSKISDVFQVVPGTTTSVAGCNYRICDQKVFVPNCALQTAEIPLGAMAYPKYDSKDVWPLQMLQVPVFSRLKGTIAPRLRKGARLVILNVTD